MKLALVLAISAPAAIANAQDVLFASDFESDDGGLVGTGDWEYGSPSGFAGAPFGGAEPVGGNSGSFAWGTVIGGAHNPSTVSELTLSGINLSDALTLSFAEFSESGGNTFDMAEVLVGGTQVYLSNGNSLLDWRDVTLDLSGISGPGDIVFRFTASGVVERVGWYIDDVVVRGIPAPATAALLGLGGLVGARRRR